MKKISSLLLMAFAVVSISAQQMNISRNGNVVTFSASVPGSDWGSTPVNLYVYLDAADNTAGVTSNPLGNWPGTPLTSGNGTYNASVDLSTFYSNGTTINNLKYIYNVSDGNGGYYQNPGGGNPGFSATDSAHTSGWSAFTIGTLAVSDVNGKTKSQVAAGKLFTSVKGNVELTVYDFSGNVIKTIKTTTNGTPIDLNLSQKGMYLVKIAGENVSEVVKFAY